MKFKAQRGTKDILPFESYKWQKIESIFKNLVELYGYQEIRTPLFEETALFTGSSGDTSDVVTKEMYTFRDKGDRSITLKPEGTASAIRAYLEHNLGSTNAINRLWYNTPIFRYGRPQKGRYRQSHQFGIELIGSAKPTADLEVIEIAVNLYKTIGISDFTLLINSIGRKEDRIKYRTALLDHVATYLSDLSLEEQDRMRKNPLRILDSKDSKAIEACKDAPIILNYLNSISKCNFETLQELLNDADITYEIGPNIVRGLDYYTDTVFEIQSHLLGTQSSLCGGGRFDDLVKQIGGPDIPCVGVAWGIERMMIAEPSIFNNLDQNKLDVFVISVSEIANKKVIALAQHLRKAGFAANYDLDHKNFKSQLKLADKLNSKFAIFIGEDEINHYTLKVKNLINGNQENVIYDHIEKWLSNMIHTI